MGLLQLAAAVAALDENTLLNRASFLMTHNSATGEDPSGFAGCNNQGDSTMVQQLECGARAFDYRPHLESSGVRAQHTSFCPVSTPMTDSVTSVIDWLDTNPNELVILYVSHFEWDSGFTDIQTKDAAAAVLTSLGVNTIRDCSQLAGLTIGDIKSLPALPNNNGGYLLAIFGDVNGGGECMDEQYDDSITCCDFTNFDNYMSTRADFPNPNMVNSSQLYMTQALWQGSGNHVELESSTNLNNYVSTKVVNGEYNFVNFLEVNNVCNNGLVLKAALDTYFNEPAPVSNCLGTNGQLVVGEYLQSNNGLYRAKLDTDGRFCTYDTADAFITPTWCTGSSTDFPIGEAPPEAGGPGILKMQGDGNLVLYTPISSPYWASGTSGTDFYLVLQNDRNLVIYQSGSTGAAWACSVNRDNTCGYVTGSSCVDCGEGDNVCLINTGSGSPSKSPTVSPSKSPSKPTVSSFDAFLYILFISSFIGSMFGSC